MFGGQYAIDSSSAATKARTEIQSDIADLAVFGPRQSGSSVVDMRNVYAYDPVINWLVRF